MRARGAAVRRDLTFIFDAAAMTDNGAVRETNEDQARMALAPGLFMVADGMGGHQSGEVASLFCVTSMSNTLAGLPGDLPAEERRDALVRAAIEANREVHTRAQGLSKWIGMGTTLVAALWCPPSRWAVINIGDSRAYKMGRDGLKQITVDHTGQQRHSIYRAIGTHADVEVDSFMVDVVPGDALLLCSDGLYEAVSTAAIARELSRPSRGAVLTLLERALENGAADNVTAIVVRVP